MKCECQLCKDIKHLRECGVSEDFMDRWLNEGMDSNVNQAILDGSWPSAVEQLQGALEKAIEIRGKQWPTYSFGASVELVHFISSKTT